MQRSEIELNEIILTVLDSERKTERKKKLIRYIAFNNSTSLWSRKLVSLEISKLNQFMVSMFFWFF